MIIDCHAHLSLMSQAETWDEALKKLLQNMEKNNISMQTLIADNVSVSNCADTKKLIELTANMPKIKIMGSINPFSFPAEDIEYFDKLLAEKKIVGLKIFPGHDKIPANDLTFEPSVDLCLKYKVPLVIHTGINTGDKDCAKYNDPKLIVSISEKYPDLKIIIAHYFWPELEYCFRITVGCGNVYFDTSALADEEVIEESGGMEKIRLIIEKTVARKSDSVIFGTDYPMCNTQDHLKLIDLLNIAATDKQNIMCNNAIRLFQI